VLMRVVLVLLVVGVILWLLAARSRAGAPRKSKPQPEAFARCAHCGVHLPINDAVVDRGNAYCSEAHRLAGPSDHAGS
jgi:uncharacterized protein